MSNPTTETYYVTKYGLTKGIFEIPPGEGRFGDSPEYLYVGSIAHSLIQVARKDFFRTLAEAEQRIEQLKEAKLRSLEKALNKIKHYKAKVTVWKDQD